LEEKRMKKTTLFLSLVLALTVLSMSALATPFTVTATTSIFKAGGATSAGGDDGISPTAFALGSGGGSLTFDSVTGTVTCGTVAGFCNGAGAPAPTSNGPDGTAYTGMAAGATNITSPGSGISGVSFTGREMFLVGVFLDASTPAGAPPATLAYTPIFADSATIFAPLIGQVFYIGNGLTGGPTDAAGVTQTFLVPVTGTRLFLGFADASGFVGAPAMYGDNQGSLSGNFTFAAASGVPEPGTIVLMGLGLMGLALLRKKIA